MADAFTHTHTEARTHTHKDTIVLDKAHPDNNTLPPALARQWHLFLCLLPWMHAELVSNGSRLQPKDLAVFVLMSKVPMKGRVCWKTVFWNFPPSLNSSLGVRGRLIYLPCQISRITTFLCRLKGWNVKTLACFTESTWPYFPHSVTYFLS